VQSMVVTMLSWLVMGRWTLGISTVEIIAGSVAMTTVLQLLHPATVCRPLDTTAVSTATTNISSD